MAFISSILKRNRCKKIKAYSYRLVRIRHYLKVLEADLIRISREYNSCSKELHGGESHMVAIKDLMEHLSGKIKQREIEEARVMQKIKKLQENV